MIKSAKRQYRWNYLKCLRNIVMLVLVLVTLSLMFSSATGAGTPPKNIIIQSGDTLWTLAVRVRPHEDPRKTVEAIRYANHLESLNITPGQMIIVP